MNHPITRRDWLKTSALITGGLALGTGAALPAQANVLRPLRMRKLRQYEEARLATEFPVLKARLFANENPFGPSQKAQQAIRDSIAKAYQYPFQSLGILVDKITSHEGIKKEQLAVSDGSTTMLHAAAVLFSRNQGEIISGDPSYDDLPGTAEVLQAVWKKAPLTPEHKLNLDALEKLISPKTSLVYVCNPNNPTGTMLDTEKLKAFCERVSARVPVFVDEAYIDYTGDPDKHTMVGLVKAGHNVIVARTFSKLYGFAGLRVGYVIAQEDMIKKLGEVVWPEAGLSATSIAAAIAAYQEKEFLNEALKKTLSSREYLYDVLKQEGYEYIPSQTNFVMFGLNMDAERFVEEMLKRGVGVRPWKFENRNWCRVSMGTMEEMEAFSKAFKEIS